MGQRANLNRRELRSIRIVVEAPDACTVDVIVRSGVAAAGDVRAKLPVGRLLEAIRTVAAGKPWHPPQAQRTVQGGSALTICEKNVVRMVALGMRSAEVALRLSVSEGTIKTHLHSAFRKLDVRNRAELTLRAITMGLVRTCEQPASAAPAA